jgi:pyruvate kinase
VERRAKIVATLGPASSSSRLLGRLLRAGVDVVRLNLSHGSHEEHRARIALVRELADAQRKHVGVLLDLMGPRFRLGVIAGGPRLLRKGERVVLDEPGPRGEGPDLPVDDPEFLGHLEPGERVLIDNGRVELRMVAKRRGRVEARVVHGGFVDTRKGINIPDTDLPFTISRKDRADIAFAVAEGADYLAASYIGRGEELARLRAVARRAGRELPVVAKLERARAIEHLDEVVEAADAVMVARGDLGVEMPLHQVPVLQKRIVAAGRRVGKPVIVATQMLESMIEQPRPTRAEASDVANAVFDGADALMLSGETAAGRHPIEAVRTMDRVIREAEAYRWAPARREGWGPAAERPLVPGETEELSERDTHLGIADVVCSAAAQAAAQLGARAIVAFSQGGFTARMIARYRPAVPIVVFTNDARVARRMQLVWGVWPALVDEQVTEVSAVVRVVDRKLLAARLVKPGDPVVILMGDPIRERPLTNLLRVHRVRRA